MISFPALPVNVQPQVTLTRWVFVNAGDRFYLVGWCLETQKVRVSTEVEDIDAASMTVTTRSRRKYLLVGEPASQVDTVWISAAWERAVDPSSNDYQ